MKLTVTVDDDVIKRARMRARQEGTTVNAALRDYLESYAGGPPGRREAIGRFLALSESSNTGRGDATWTRDELYDR